MKLRNKKTGEIKEVIVGGYPVSGKTKMWECSEMDMNEETGYKYLGIYTSLAELNEEWEDASEEPKNYFYLTAKGNIHNVEDLDDEGDEQRKVIGNYFETREEAEKAVEKLKAFKRLQDLGFRFEGIRFRGEHNYIEWKIKAKNELTDDEIEEFRDGLQKVFGGEYESNQ